jgi:hypothetical protein
MDWSFIHLWYQQPSFLQKKKSAYMHIVHAHIHKPTCNNSFFISAIWNATQSQCEATICFLAYKRWQQQDMKFKRSMYVCVCVCVCVCACARNAREHTHTHTKYEFHKNPLCWVSSPLRCDALSLGEQFLIIQGILVPLKYQQPLVQQHSITS